MTLAANPIDALLAAYASGQVPEPVRILIEAQLEISPVHHGFVGDLEAMGAAEIEAIAPVPLADRDRALARIFAAEPEPVSARRAARTVAAGSTAAIMPPALQQFLGHGLDQVPWRGLLRGVKAYNTPVVDGCKGTLYWIRAGRPIPEHTHGGLELTLVLQGSFSDGYGRYGRGDIAVADDEIDHRPIADDGEDCICFAVTDAPLRLTGPIGRLLSPFFKGQL